MKQTRAILKTWFERGDRPTQAQFGDLIDSIFNLTDDLTLLTSIGDFDPSATYIAGQIVIYRSSLYVARVSNISGTFNPTQWNELNGNAYRYLTHAPLWVNGTNYVIGDFVTSSGNVYYCNTAHTSNSSNIAPNNSFWTFINIYGNEVQKWNTGAWIQDDVVFYNRSFYKCLVPIINSVDLPTELVANKWKFVSQPASWSSSTQYVVNEFVWVGTVFYRCLINHTSTSSFSTDLTNGNWLAYNVTLPLTNDLSSSIVSNTGPWVFTLSPAPNAIIGVFVNGQLQKLIDDYTQTGSNNEIITWVSTDFNLEIGDKLIIIYQ